MEAVQNSVLESIATYNLTLKKIQYLKKSNILKVFVSSDNEIDVNNVLAFKRCLNANINFCSRIEVILNRNYENLTMEYVLEYYWKELVESAVKEVPLSKMILSNCKKRLNDEKVIIYHGNKYIFDILEATGFCKKFSKIIEEEFNLRYPVELTFDEELSLKYNTHNDNVHEAEQPPPPPMPKNEYKPPVLPLKEVKKVVTTGSKNIVMGKDFNDGVLDIIEINEPMGKIAVCGEIFKVEVVETKTKKKLYNIHFTDFTSSLLIKFFLKEKDLENVLENIKAGFYGKIRGNLIYDTFSRELVLMAQDIIKLDKQVRMDNAEQKRVELHLHTKMSAMDAVTSMEDIVKRAAKWGHTAIGLTDHGVVQAFPEAMESSKKYGVKILYGVEGYMVDDDTKIVLNPSQYTLDDEFVVFDIETTGFSPDNDNIIEIGAVKIKDGKIIDNFSELIDPNRKLSSKIIEITNITDDMLLGKPPIEEVLPKFMEFCKGAVLVAHNAAFDISFINKNCKRQGFEHNFTVVDTLQLSRMLYTDLKRHKLDSVCKYLKISLLNHHRAEDDAKACGEILIHSIKRLKAKEIFTLQQLNMEFKRTIDVKKLNTYHTVIYAKNQKGIKKLYEIISDSHLNSFYKRPRIKKSMLMEYRDDLVIGSACESGLLFREILSGKSDDELKNVVEFYDYLEIQPIDNNRFLINNGTVQSDEDLRDLNRRIVKLGEKYDRPVVATCDVHFLDPHMSIYRRVLLKGLGFSDGDNDVPLYFRTTEEMLNEFSYLGEEKCYEVVITNTNMISNMIEEVKPIPDETYTPKIPGSEDEIRNLTLSNVKRIYGDNLPEVIKMRVDKELNSIINNGYAVLYLIAHKLVKKSYSDGYLVGSRGSVGSSFVATMCGITEVNGLPPHYVCPNCKNSEFILDGSVASGVDLPNKPCPNCGTQFRKDGFDIPFETFLGFDGDKEPDIDLNFSGEYQPVVHKYTEELFGKGYVFRAGTIGSIAEKTAYGFSKKYFEEKGMTVANAEVERLAQGCNGVKRTTGQHPGGIMVVPNDNDIHNFTPIQHPADDTDSSIITTHFDYHSISGRLLKLDILGHDDPTILRMLQDLTGIDPKSIPLDDPKVLSLFTSTEALNVDKEELGCELGCLGIPEFGTKFVRQMLLETKPKTFSDLVRISGLSHGTDVWINNAQYFIKEGYTTLKDCIATRDGIMVYLLYKGLEPKTSFTIMEKVRKGKGLSEEHEKVMKEHDVPDWYIESCKRIKYMFPLGHAVAYVMMAIRIAYFKVYYPLAYYATYFSVRSSDFDADLIVKGESVIKNKMDEMGKLGNNATAKDKNLLTILEICYEMYKRGFRFLRADIYKSDSSKFLIEGDSLIPPLNSLQGVGETAAKFIVEARGDGEFLSIEDLKKRAKLTKTAIEMLSQHGCLKNLGERNQISLF